MPYPDTRGGGGGTGSARTPVIVSGSPFNDLAALNTWSQANQAELFNEQTEVIDGVLRFATAVVDGSAYRWDGANQSFSTGGWVLFQRPPQDIDVSENVLAMGTSAGGLADSIVTQPDETGVMIDGEVSSTKDTINIGQGLSISEDGLDIKATNPVEGLEAIPARTLLNQDGTTGQNLVVQRSNRQMVVLQPATSETQIGDWTAHVPVTETRIVKAIGSRFVSAATGVRVTVRNAADASDTTGVILYQSHTDVEWVNGGGITITPAPAVTTLTIDNSAKFILGNMVYVVVEQHPTGTGTLELQGITTTIGGVGPQFFAYLEQSYVTETLDEIALMSDIPTNLEGDHPITLRRDMPSQADSLALAQASLNDNSAVWIVANDQQPTSNRSTATLVAQRAGLFDLQGNAISTTPAAANNVQMRSGSIVRIFGQDDFRIVSSPVFESDIDSGTAPTTPQPRFTRFEFQTQETSVAPGTTISGLKTFLIGIERPDLLTGHLRIEQDGTVLTENTILPTVNSAGVPITSTTLTNSGDTSVFTVTATIAAGGTITAHITVRAYRPHELAYHGIRATNDLSTVNLSDLDSTDVTVNSEFDVTGAFANTAFIGILVPSNMDVRRITTLGTPVTDSFTRTENARTINSQAYVLYTLQNVGGIDGQAAYTVEV